MHVMKKIIITFCLFATILSAAAQKAQNDETDTNRRIDSVKALLPSLEGRDRLDAYNRLDSLYTHANSMDEHVACMDEAIKYARQQKDFRAEGLARRNLLEAYYNKCQTLSLYMERMDGDMDFWRRNEQWDYYYFAFFMIADIDVSDNKAQAVLDRARREYDDAKARNYPPGKGVASFVMGLAYHRLGRYDEAVKCFEEAVDILKKEPFMEFGSMLMEVYDTFTYSAYNNDDADGALRVLDDWGELLKANAHRISPINRVDWYFHCAAVYSGLGRLDEAERMLNEAEKLTPGMGNEVDLELKNIYMGIYIERKQYDKALSIADSIKNNIQLLASGYNHLQRFRLLIADSTGNIALAAEIYKDLYLRNDSISKVEMAAQLDELRTVYEVDKHVTEKQRNRNYFILAATGCLLLSVIVMLVLLNRRKIARKNRGLVRQIKEQDRLAEELEQMRRRYETPPSPAAVPVETQNFASLPSDNETDVENTDRHYYRLFVRLRDYLLSNRNFAKPDIDRKELISSLGTNRTYLFEAVKAVTGKTLQEYIHSLRLDEAKRMLDTTGESIEDIAQACGFNTIRTFYRLFRERYDITPAEYRKNTKNVPLV
jgi:AraC-like DNA-binding protein